MKYSICKTFLVTALTLTLAACNSTKETPTEGLLGEIKNRAQIVIGVKTDYRPFGFIDQNGNNAGLEIDIARYVSKELLGSEAKIKFEPVVAANRIEFLQQGKVDIVIATMTDTPKRRQVIDFSENYYAAGTGLLTRKDSGVATWDDLKGKKVCGIQGSFYNKQLSEMGLEMLNFPGTAEAYTALKDGRCLGFAYDNSAIAGKLLEPEWAKDWHQPKTLEIILVQPWGMGVKKGESALLEAVNQAILKMEAENFIVDGEQKWQIPATEYVKNRAEMARKKLNL
ncbi:MAG: ABC transporter substrate-binding protein [Cyanobacteria bacterium J083]|nr:MAG: ABC transporter substrate-binding protein [Cyanobacteria bacterium J083]